MSTTIRERWSMLQPFLLQVRRYRLQPFQRLTGFILYRPVGTGGHLHPQIFSTPEEAQAAADLYPDDQKPRVGRIKIPAMLNLERGSRSAFTCKAVFLSNAKGDAKQ